MYLRLLGSQFRLFMFKLKIARECHFTSASVVLDDGNACPTVDFGQRCTPGPLIHVLKI